MYEVLGTSPLTGSGPPFPPLYRGRVKLNPGRDWCLIIGLTECLRGLYLFFSHT